MDTALQPVSAEALLHTLRDLQTAGKQVTLFGSGTRYREKRGVILSTQALNKMKFFHPEDMVIGVEAGMKFRELHDVLAEHGMELPVNAWYEAATIGGMVAANDFGPDRLFSGGMRDYLIGVEYVDGSANLVKAGGRVVKNVTGYDATRMMIGSRGGLGCLVTVNFRLVPQKQHPMVGFCAFQANDSWDAIRSAWKSLQAMISAKMPLDWVQIRRHSTWWYFAFGYSGNLARQQRLHQWMKEYLNEFWQFEPEGELPDVMAWAKTRSRQTGFLQSVQQQNGNDWHFHIVGSTSSFNSEEAISVFQGIDDVVLHPFGGDAHVFFKAKSEKIPQIKKVLQKVGQWGWVECIHAPVEILAQYGTFFPSRSDDWLIRRLKKQLDPNDFYWNSFYGATSRSKPTVEGGA